MTNSVRTRWRQLGAGAGLLVLALAAAVLPEPARADMIFLKDGFVIQGKVRREGVTEFDPGSKEPVFIPKGFFLVDDGPRRVFFSQSRVRIAEKLAAPVEVKIAAKHGRLLLNPKEMPAIHEVVDVPEFDSRWERTFSFRTSGTRSKVKTILAELTPYYFRTDALEKVVWHAAYLTKELTPEAVQTLLNQHPDFQENGKLTPAQVTTKRMRRIDFYGQAGFLDLAEKELDRLLKDVPDQKERVEAARRALAKLKARERLEEIKHWLEAGRHKAVRKALADFPESDVPEAILGEVRELRTRDARTQTQLKDAARLLEDSARECNDPTQKLLVEAAEAIRKELHPDNVDRLDAFLGQALQAERQRQAGKKPGRTPANLLSLAVTGWLLGSASAEGRPEAAINLWKTRQMVLNYLLNEEAGERRKLLDEYSRTVTPRVELDEVAQMIPVLPPIAPATDLGDTPTERTVVHGRGTVKYQIQLPPEYSHDRSYPVLVVLNNSGEKNTTMLDRWAQGAAEHGYILVAPEWEQGLGGSYGYSDAEHAAVLATLRDLKRCYKVDSDRVFLHGLGEGGKMAFDVGLSHPGLFAGVLPMGTAPFYFPGRCWRNAQYLPFYVVNGGLAGDSAKQLRQVFNFWILRGFPALWVSYKGRGQEWFGGEVPNMFDWMRRQVRAMPMQELGTDGLGGSSGNEFTTLRPSGNRFYWLSADEVSPRNTSSIARWNNLTMPATVTARTDLDTNEVTIKAAGILKLSVWVLRTPRGQYTLDLEKPVTIRVGLRNFWVNRRVSPNLGVMLEDLYERGDRQHLAVARLELNFR